MQDAVDLQNVYDPMRRIARALLRKERRDCSIDATELVHQTLVSKMMKVPVTNCERYLGLAVHAMRQVIIDRARRRITRNRNQVALEASTKRAGPELEIMIRHELKKFARTDSRGARVVAFRVLEHRTWEEIAALENVSVRTARDDYQFAIAWLRSRFCSETA